MIIEATKFDPKTVEQGIEEYKYIYKKYPTYLIMNEVTKTDFCNRIFPWTREDRYDINKDKDYEIIFYCHSDNDLRNMAKDRAFNKIHIAICDGIESGKVDII